MKKSLYYKIIPCVALFKLFSNDLTAQTSTNDTIKVFADKRIISFKGKDLDFNGCIYRIVERGNNNPDNNSIILKREKSNELIEVFIVIKKVSDFKAKYYIVIDGEKHFVKLDGFLRYKSKEGKEFILKPNDGYYESDGKVMHSDHYSHYSHRSSLPKKIK